MPDVSAGTNEKHDHREEGLKIEQGWLHNKNQVALYLTMDGMKVEQSLRDLKVFSYHFLMKLT
jgi:hypothetical protein